MHSKIKQAQGPEWQRPDPTAGGRKRLAHKIWGPVGTQNSSLLLQPRPAAQLSWVLCGAETPLALSTCPYRRRVPQGVRGSPGRAAKRHLSNRPLAGRRRGPEGLMSYPDIKHGAWAPQIPRNHTSRLAGCSLCPGHH